MMTDVKLPSPEEKMQAQQQAQMMAQQQQPIPGMLQKVLDKPTGDECLQVLRDDKQRSYRVDIETDATVSGNQAADQEAMTGLLQGVSSFIGNAGPAVAAGYLPLEAAKSMLISAVRRFKMGREVEDALDMIGEDQQGGGDEAAQQQQQAAQQAEQQAAQQEQAAAAQEAQMKMQMDQQNAALKAQEAQQNAKCP